MTVLGEPSSRTATTSATPPPLEVAVRVQGPGRPKSPSPTPKRSRTPGASIRTLNYIDGRDDALRGADAVVVVTEWDEYRRQLSPSTQHPSPPVRSSSTDATASMPPPGAQRAGRTTAWVGRSMSASIKAVIPAAGLGTRFLPATKAMPKEMLPVVDKPAIQYVVEEAVAAGIDDIVVIIGRNKNALANHFDRVTELEHTLERKGDHGKLARVMETSSMADIHFVRQGDPNGLGHAVLRGRKHVNVHSPSCSATTSSTRATRCCPA